MNRDYLTDVPTRVPDKETPAATCEYCGRPFGTDRGHDLHLGEAHDDELTEAQREAYEHAREEESDELFLYHFKVVVALGIVYSVTVLAYMVALGSGIV